MCYASAEGRARNARQGEVLLVQRQPYGANWLVSPDNSKVAVCLKDGTEVELLYIPGRTQRQFKLPKETKATFKMENWWRRDIFVVGGRQKVPLKKLQPGQVVRVLVEDGALSAEELDLQEERAESLSSMTKRPR